MGFQFSIDVIFKWRPRRARRLSHTLLWWTLRSNSNLGCRRSRVVTFSAIRPWLKARPGQKFENENFCFRRTPAVVKACHPCRVRLIKTPLHKTWFPILVDAEWDRQAVENITEERQREIFCSESSDCACVSVFRQSAPMFILIYTYLFKFIHSCSRGIIVIVIKH